MKKEPVVFLLHILEALDIIKEFLEGISEEEFKFNIEKQYAVIRGLEIIGEAVKNLTEEFTEKYPDVGWSDVAATRDKLIHHYFGVDLQLTWDIVKNDLPILEEKIKEILAAEEKKRNDLESTEFSTGLGPVACNFARSPVSGKILGVQRKAAERSEHATGL